MVRQLILCLLVSIPAAASAQMLQPPPVTEDHPEGCGAKSAALARAGAAPGAYADPSVDVTYYRLALTLETGRSTIVGRVLTAATIVADSVSTIILDLSGSMAVDSAFAAARPAPAARIPDGLVITLDRVYRRGERVEVEVAYHGTPATSGFGSFVFSSAGSAPWVWSLSQPYGAKDWWPCKDHPVDKADSVDVIVTGPAGLRVGSNGRLRSRTDNGDGTWTHHWAERYPIASYLVSIAMTDYAEFSDWFRYAPTDSMEVLSYVLPQSLDDARGQLAVVVPMLAVFSDRFGLYPFIKEKYGNAQFGRGGAMEHQTMTSTTTFNEDVTAHELAHQWYGDLVTCANWQELWLNEGFATYSEAIFREAAYGRASFLSHVRQRMGSAKEAPGTLFVQDTSDVRELFRYSRVYAKGAMVLHMLRRVLGDSSFFRSLRAYAADPRYRYGVATTRDFQGICEATSGMRLDWFFDQWVFGERFPRYALRWTSTAHGASTAVDVLLEQTTGTSSPSFFRMPVDLRFSSATRDTTVTVMHTASGELFTVLLSFQPDEVVLDPDEWLLKEVTEAGVLIPESALLQQNYPNPFNAGTTIRFALPSRAEASIRVYDLIGRRVRTLDEGIREPGPHTVTWDGADDRGIPCAAGVYYYRLNTGSTSLTRPMLLLR